MKTCPRCGASKPHEEFYKDASRADGLDWHCKPCSAIITRARRERRRARFDGFDFTLVTKVCADCNVEKRGDGFYRNHTAADGLDPHCSACHIAKTAARATRNLASWDDFDFTQIAKTCIQCEVEKRGNEFPRHGGFSDGLSQYCRPCFALYKRARKYGLSIEEIQSLLSVTECEACGCEFKSEPHIDHCHDSGVVRGLLCRNCNLALGLVYDDADRLRALTEYAEKHAHLKETANG